MNRERKEGLVFSLRPLMQLSSHMCGISNCGGHWCPSTDFITCILIRGPLLRKHDREFITFIFMCIESGFVPMSLEVESQCCNPLYYQCSPQCFSWVAFCITLILVKLSYNLRSFLFVSLHFMIFFKVILLIYSDC